MKLREEVSFVSDFVPNDLKMNEKSYFHIITGPNMAGKSTYIRQSAIIIILAQIGSFIPAKKGRIGVVDGIYTRIGSGDVLSKGLSTFMVEMLEVANILNNITEKSFVVLDEVGRGTSTYDGLSIAWAVSEISKNIKAKTLFATHYHELTKLEDEIRGVKNFHMHINEDGENIKFLYKVMEGFSNKSYGVHVAKLAGIKEEIIKRAYEILYHLEEEQEKKIDETIINLSQKREDYLPLFSQLEEENNSNQIKQILKEIEEIDLADMTPIEAMVFLNNIKNRIKKMI